MTEIRNDCPRCRAPVGAVESHCAGCGIRVRLNPSELQEVKVRLGAARQRQIDLRKIRTGRNWLLAVAILSLFGAGLSYVIARAELDRTIQGTDRELAPLSPEEREASLEEYRLENGRSWDETIEATKQEALHDLMLDLAVVAFFFAAYVWARQNPLAGVTSALVAFVASNLVQVAMNGPLILCQGAALRLFVTVALVVACVSALQYRNYRGTLGD